MDPAALFSQAPEHDSTDTSRITALIKLLADDDPKVGEAISDHLRDIGPAALPALKEAAGGENPLVRARCEVLVAELLEESVIAALQQFARAPRRDLEEGLVLLARLHTPDLDPAPCTMQISRMTEELMIRLDPGDGVDRVLNGLSRYLHEQMGFTGNTGDYHNPDNSYLHTVLSSRKGIPISLSAIYLVLARRLGLPMSGLGMPGHFLVKYDDGHEVRIIDPFHRGRILDREGCARLLRGHGLAFDERYLEPVTTRYILERTVKNLIALFAERDDQQKLTLHERALDALRSA